MDGHKYAASLFIDGRDVERTGADRFAVMNPATESALGDVPGAGPSEVASALAAAERGFIAWRGKTPWERSAVLRRIAALLRERGPEIATLLTLEVGKPLAESMTEVAVAAEYFDWCADEARRIFGRTIAGRVAGSHLEVSHEPVGVVLALTAWNFPVVLASRKLAMALAAGCAVVLRPAEEAPACVAALVRCCHDAGLPAGTVNLLFGTPDAIVAPLMASASVRKVSFTGSTRVGQILIRQSADTIKRLTLELGGHAPFIVLEDADLDHAAAAAVTAKLRNAGQVCTAPSRFLIHEAVARPFLDKMTALARAVTLGDGLHDGVQMGPLATSRQHERSARLVEEARSKGATIACGGSRPTRFNRGYFFAPTVLTNLSEDAAVLTEEPFGPIAVIIPVANAEDAIRRANALEYGLAAYLFTRSRDAIDEVTATLQAGAIGVNTTVVALPEAAFGGVKQSGFGREGGEEGMREYLNPKFVHRMRA
ncbi:MAG: NAD-dependent succinate-semialdehyde dehydrogenase [Casimicrobiaceae bacterium]